MKRNTGKLGAPILSAIAVALFSLLIVFASSGVAGEAKPKPKPKPEPPPETKFNRGRLRGKFGETVWYRFQPKKPQMIILVQKVLARYGLQHGKDFVLDRHDALGLLAISGKSREIRLVRSLIEFLEEEQPQVRLKVRIVETISTRDLQTGLDSSLDRKTSEETFFQGYQVNHQPQSYLDSVVSTTIPYLGSTAGFGTVDTVDSDGNFVSTTRENVGAMDLAIRAIAEHQNANVLAEPELLLSSGARGIIKNVQKYPYQQVQISGTTAKVTVNYLTFGVTLNVTCHLIGDGKIHLQIDMAVENQAGFVEIGAGTQYPYSSRRTVKTGVIVPSGFEIVIGGLFQKEYAVIEKGVPFLSDIPILGYLFKSYWRVKNRKELLFFLRPRLLSPQSRLFAPGG